MKKSGPAAYVVKENFRASGRKFRIDDIVFVGEKPPLEGLLYLTRQELRQVPSEYLEPALDPEVQGAAKAKADGALAACERAFAAAEQAVADAEVHYSRELARRDQHMRELKHRVELARQDLEAEQARHAQAIEIFGATFPTGGALEPKPAGDGA